MVVDHNTIDNKLYHAVHYVLFQEQVSVRGDWDKLLQKLPYIGNCEEELPKKPVGRLSADSLPTG